MKTDSIFYRLFQEFPDIFFELIGNFPLATNTYQFSSVEIKQTAFRIDGVFLPQQSNDNPIYFVEVNGTPPYEGGACVHRLPRFNFNQIQNFTLGSLPKYFYTCVRINPKITGVR